MNTKSEWWSADIAAQTMDHPTCPLGVHRHPYTARDIPGKLFLCHLPWSTETASHHWRQPDTIAVESSTDEYGTKRHEPVYVSGLPLIPCGRYGRIPSARRRFQTVPAQTGRWCVPMISAAVCVTGRNLSRRCVGGFTRSCATVITCGRPDQAQSLLEPVMVWHSARCTAGEWWTPNVLAMIRALCPAWSMPMVWSLWGCDSHCIMDIIILDSILMVFYWDWVCTMAQWSNSSLSFTHLLLWVTPGVTIAKRHISVAQQSHWTGTTQDNIFLSLNTVLNSHQHIFGDNGHHTFQKMDIENGAFLFSSSVNTFCCMCERKNQHLVAKLLYAENSYIGRC